MTIEKRRLSTDLTLKRQKKVFLCLEENKKYLFFILKYDIYNSKNIIDVMNTDKDNKNKAEKGEEIICF